MLALGFQLPARVSESSKAGSLLLLEEIVESFADVICLDSLSATPRSKWYAVIGLKIVAIVGRKLVANVFRLWFAALIVLARVEEPAVLAAVHVCAAMRTLVPVRDFGDDFYFAPAVMTDHR